MNVWFWNLSSESRDALAATLAAGSLRQGWGYHDSLDLKALKGKINEAPTDEEIAAWRRCGAMLHDIRPGDLVCVKGVLDGHAGSGFTLVKVVGEYRYEEADPVLKSDFRHALPVETIGSYHYQSHLVSPELERALSRHRHPLRRAYVHAEAAKSLLPGVHTTPEGFRERKRRLRDIVFESLAHSLSGLNPRNFEDLVEALLGHMGYTDIKRTAGRAERGADFTARFEGPGGVSVKAVVQVKHHSGVHNDTKGLDQIEHALDAHVAKLGLLVSSARGAGEGLQRRHEDMARSEDVAILLGDEFYETLLNYLADDARRDRLESRA